MRLFMALITLKEWNARQPRPRSLETVRRWVRQSKIYPAPKKDGVEYLFQETAIKVEPSQSSTCGLLRRMTNGKKKKP
ncbi:TPA: excisionase [Klebsiella michiganensis]|nr:excisionase [Klebsiella michiganensis]HDW0211508.1 excisionase [Klebsiella michiganensis]